MAVGPVAVYPSALTRKCSDCSPVTVGRLFSNQRISPFLSCAPVSSSGGSTTRRRFLRGRRQVSLSKMRPGCSVVIHGNGLTLARGNRRNRCVLGPGLDSFHGQVCDSTGRGLAVRVTSRMFKVRATTGKLYFFGKKRPTCVAGQFSIGPSNAGHEGRSFTSLTKLAARGNNGGCGCRCLACRRYKRLVQQCLPT